MHAQAIRLHHMVRTGGDVLEKLNPRPDQSRTLCKNRLSHDDGAEKN